MTESKCTRSFVVIGTSGSTDYLNDTTGDRRYWAVSAAPVADTSPIDNEAHAAIVKELVEMCDGLHDENTPAHYLCSRCFRNILVEHDDDHRDEP